MENNKNRAIIILLSLAVILFIFNISSCNNATLKTKNLAKEQAVRMNLEEKIVNLEAEITKLKLTLTKTNKDFDTLKKLLADQQLLNENLKEQLQKTKDAKEALEASKKR